MTSLNKKLKTLTNYSLLRIHRILRMKLEKNIAEDLFKNLIAMMKKMKKKVWKNQNKQSVQG
jgi:hypothetical protein